MRTKADSVVRSKGDKDLERWAVEQHQGFGFGIWSVPQVEDVPIGTQTADDGGPRWGVNGLALEADGDFAILAHAQRRI